MQLGGFGECCKLPQWDLGQIPSGNRIWCIFPYNMTFDGSNFTNFHRGLACLPQMPALTRLHSARAFLIFRSCQPWYIGWIYFDCLTHLPVNTVQISSFTYLLTYLKCYVTRPHIVVGCICCKTGQNSHCDPDYYYYYYYYSLCSGHYIQLYHDCLHFAGSLSAVPKVEKISSWTPQDPNPNPCSLSPSLLPSLLLLFTLPPMMLNIKMKFKQLFSHSTLMWNHSHT